jgi:hypothetical protein
MDGSEYLDYRELLRRAIEDDDIAHVVLIVERKDQISEVWYDRQMISQVVYASALLHNFSQKLIEGTRECTCGKA